MLQGFVTKKFRDLHRVDELKNFAANILLKLVVSHVLGSVHRFGQSRIGSRGLKGEIVTTEQVQLCIGVRVQLQGVLGKGDIVTTEQVQGTGIPLLVTACCYNSGFSRVVTSNSPGGVLSWKFSPFVNKSLCQLYFLLHINLVGDLFVLPRVLHVN